MLTITPIPGIDLLTYVRQFYVGIAPAFFTAASVGSFINTVAKYSQTFAVSVKWRSLKSISLLNWRGNRRFQKRQT